MCALAMAPKIPGKVRPAGTSYSPSAAEASTSVTPSVGSDVIFSTPPTRTTSYMPLAMAITPSRKALPLLAHAFSMRVIGRGGHAQPIGHDGRRVALVLKQVGRVVSQIAGLDVLGGYARVDGLLHILERFDEQVAAGLVGVCSELGQARRRRWDHRAEPSDGNEW